MIQHSKPFFSESAGSKERGVRRAQWTERYTLGSGGALLCGLIAVAGASATPAAAGQTFNEATTAALQKFSTSCDGFTQAETTLRDRCTARFLPGGQGGAVGGSSGSSVGTGIAPSAVQERLRTSRKRNHGSSRPSGASADSVINLSPGFSLFVAPGYERLSHNNNSYEDGYKSDIGRLTVGGDYQFTKWFLGGLALNYSYNDAVYDDGEGFNRNTYGLTIYTSILPWENTFVDFTAGYAWEQSNESRVARLFRSDGSQYFPASDAPEQGNGRVRSDYQRNQFTAAMLAGYDYPIGNITVGPRAGFYLAYQKRGRYSEDGKTGLELEYNSDSETSLQTSLGAAATVAVSTSFGVLLPQIDAAWAHEFADDQRNITARFRESIEATAGHFTYNSESPDRNFGVIGVGLTAVLPNGLQPFMAFRTIVGNDRYNSYAVSAGLRLEL